MDVVQYCLPLFGNFGVALGLPTDLPRRAFLDFGGWSAIVHTVVADF
jgi:hypothetical protein